jgi:ElaA protein
VREAAERVKTMGNDLTWGEYEFGQLSLDQLYDLLALRAEVFVVEQRCIYQDLDGLDRVAVHLLGQAADGRLLAYQRCLPPGTAYAESGLGRIVVSPAARGRQLGRVLVERGLACNARRWPGCAVRINAQAYLAAFYSSLGFVAAGDVFDEDGIPHLQMTWRAGAIVREER